MQTVVITGAASGMGLSATELFLKKGWNVVMADFDADNGQKYLMQFQQEYGSDRVLFQKTNVADAESIAQLQKVVVSKYPVVDAIINNAGVFVKGALHEVTEDAWDRIMAIDVKSIYLMTKAFVPGMIQQKHGAIINTASVSGILGDYNMAAYSAAKGAVVNLVRSMALDYGQYNIRVNNVAPGPTNTPMFQQNSQSVIDAFNQASPLKHIVEPADIANMMYYLASDEARSITGQNVQVTAGFGIHTGQLVQ